MARAAAAWLGSLPGLYALDLRGSLVCFLKAGLLFVFSSIIWSNFAPARSPHASGDGDRDTSDALWGWSITTMGRVCSSHPIQPQLYTLLCRGTLIITIIINTTHSITFSCLHLLFCNFNENFKSRSWCVLGASSLSFSHASFPACDARKRCPCFPGEGLSGGEVCSRDVGYETFSLLLAFPPSPGLREGMRCTACANTVIVPCLRCAFSSLKSTGQIISRSLGLYWLYVLVMKSPVI